VPVNGQAQFSAFLASAPTATFTWSVSSGSGNGTINSSTGLYTAPSSIPSPATVTITATGSGATGTATINIVAAATGGLAIAPAVVVVPAGQTFTFSATANGNAITPIWQVNGITSGDSADGLISATGVYTAPLTPPPGGSTIVTAESGGNSATATVVVVFSNASLNGPYAFSYAGQDTKGPLLVAGSFTANSSAASISGIEDYNSTAAAPVQASPVSGTFSINPDGSGTATLTDAAAGGSETWNLTLVASPQGQASPRALLVRFDKTATGSGEADQQNTATFALSAFNGNYAFNLSGNNGTGKPLQITGMVDIDGPDGTIPLNRAEEDINDAGTNTESAADTTLHGIFAASANLATNGRGTLQLMNANTEVPAIVGPYTFAFYIVDNTHLKVVETDAKAAAQLSGDFFSAPNTDGSFSTSVLKGSYAFTLLGANVNGTASYAIGGVLVANGTGSITGGVFDLNSGGSVTSDTSIASSSYSLDDVGLGRISFALTNESVTRNFAAYTTSSGAVEIIELDTDILANGTGYLQTSVGVPEGSFALNLTSNGNTSAFTEEDVIGQVSVPGGAVIPLGNIDIDDKGTVTTGAPIENTSAIVAPDANGRGTTMLETRAANYSLAYYVVDNGSALTIEIDGQRVATGIVARQF